MTGLRSLALQNRCSRIHPAKRSSGFEESFLCSVSADGSVDDDAIVTSQRIVVLRCSGRRQRTVSIALYDALRSLYHVQLVQRAD